MNKITFDYPLRWLPQRKRTVQRERARFGKHSAYKAGNELISELVRLGAKNIVISSNLLERSRGDGFYVDQPLAKEDPGIVVYFMLKGSSKAMACDCWDRVEHNLRALSLSISAIRGLERWGGSDFLDGLFDGFKALPAPSDVVEMSFNYFSDINDYDHLRTRYRNLVKELHPDVTGGDSSDYMVMQRQYDIELLKYEEKKE